MEYLRWTDKEGKTGTIATISLLMHVLTGSRHLPSSLLRTTGEKFPIAELGNKRKDQGTVKAANR